MTSATIWTTCVYRPSVAAVNPSLDSCMAASAFTKGLVSPEWISRYNWP